MKKYSIVFLLMMFNFAFADVWQNPANIEQLLSNIPKLSSISCKFKQEKTFVNIKKPIISSGDFKFVENKGVYFYTTYPIKSTVDYTNENYKQINDIIQALSQKKYKRIEKEFDFYFEKNKTLWTVGLKPKKNTKSCGILSSISVTGKDYIEKIEVKMVNGNKTTLWFEE